MLSIVGMRTPAQSAGSLVAPVSLLSLASPRSPSVRPPSPSPRPGNCFARISYDDDVSERGNLGDVDSGEEGMMLTQAPAPVPLGPVDVNNVVKMSDSAKRRARKKKLQAAWETNKAREKESTVTTTPTEAAAEGTRGQGPQRKTKRGGEKSRQRKDRATVREMLGDTGSPDRALPMERVVKDVTWSEGGASGVLVLDDSPELADEKEVEALVELQGDIDYPGQVEQVVSNGEMTAARAKRCIDRYFAGEPGFIDKPENKLVLWQALCVELGSAAPCTLRDGPPEQRPVPTTLCSARSLLKAAAHVNLHDYMDARKSNLDSYSHLVHPSASAVRRYTKTHRKAAKLDIPKREWLGPLLRDFGYRRGKRTPVPPP